MPIALATLCLDQQLAFAHPPPVAEALELLEVWVDAERAYRQIPGICVSAAHDPQVPCPRVQCGGVMQSRVSRCGAQAEAVDGDHSWLCDQMRSAS